MTYRRDKLLRLVQAGRVVLVSSYHFEDMFGATTCTTEMPVAITPPDYRDRKPGVCYLFASDFTGYGRAWLNDNGTVTLYVHSNCHYTFRILDAAAKAA